MKKVLFITHQATRTGAPLILLHLIRWLNKNTSDYQFDILILDGGSIKEDFETECTNVYLYSELHKTPKFSLVLKKRLLTKLGIKPKNKERLLLENIGQNKYDLIYANTIVSIPVALKIKSIIHESKLLLHVHELNTVIKMVLPSFKDYCGLIDRFVAVSKKVKNNLVENYNVDPNLINVVHAFGLSTSLLHKSTDSDTFILGASGSAYWAKGYDIFILIATQFVKKYPNLKIKFVWVGDHCENKIIIEQDIFKLGLTDKVIFVGEVHDPEKYYQDFDVFLLTSREDSFPMVCIENAKLMNPIICFEKASGTAEIIEKGGGYVVPYLDIEGMVEKIKFYYDNPDKRKEDGEMAKHLFSELSPEKICPLLYEQIVLSLK